MMLTLAFLSRQYLVNRMETRSALKRMATPEEVAEAALWLLCGKSSFVTGVNLVVDGGYLLF